MIVSADDSRKPVCGKWRWKDIRELFFLARVEAADQTRDPSKYLPPDGVSDGLQNCYKLLEQTAEKWENL